MPCSRIAVLLGQSEVQIIDGQDVPKDTKIREKVDALRVGDSRRVPRTRPLQLSLITRLGR